MAKKKSEQKETVKAAPQVEAQPSPKYSEPKNGILFTYTNHVQVGQTMFDLRLLFGEVLDAKPDGMHVENRVHVTMTWLHAKMLYVLLGHVIRKFEAKHGVIGQDVLRTDDEIDAEAQQEAKP
ncbi:MAG: DUF3467 domain-containing protein [Candidatus Acidiferrales bacterium]